MKNLTLCKNKSPGLLLVVAVTSFCLAGSNHTAFAQDSRPESYGTVATSQEIIAQELELKEKMLEFEKAKLDLQKSEAMDLRKAQLEIDIKKLELMKARRDLMVQETKSQLDMLLEGDVLFDTNSTAIKPGAAPVLRQVAMILSEYPKGKVVVTGYADSSGTSQDNLELSRKRGESVKTYLLDKSQGLISSERVVAQGLGETNPVATNKSSAGRQMNRRVDITVTKSLDN